jgi:hypothetical protein
MTLILSYLPILQVDWLEMLYGKMIPINSENYLWGSFL